MRFVAIYTLVLVLVSAAALTYYHAADVPGQKARQAAIKKAEKAAQQQHDAIHQADAHAHKKPSRLAALFTRKGR